MWNYIDNITNIYGKNIVFISGLFFLHIVTYWIISLIFISIDIIKPSFLYKYKIQNNINNYITFNNILKCSYQVLINQLISIFIIIIYSDILSYRNFNTSFDTLPNIYTCILNFIVFLIFEEIGFYYMHRFSHYKYIYKYIHKQHHEYVTPIALSAIYCHPLEHIFVNIAPLFIGPLIMNSHLILIWSWIFIATVNTLYSHCGYHFPLTLSNEVHDYHHLYFNECYGILGILDNIHKTNTNYYKSKQYKRDKIYKINEYYPII